MEMRRSCPTFTATALASTKIAIMTSLVSDTRLRQSLQQRTDCPPAIAKRTAESLGVRFHKTLMSEEALADNFEEATWHNEIHMPDLNYIGK